MLHLTLDQVELVENLSIAVVYKELSFQGILATFFCTTLSENSIQKLLM